MGNGPSLNSLSEEEKELLRANDTMAMNSYILHYREIGILPRHYILRDWDEVSAEVLSESEAILSSPEFDGTTLWLSEPWKNKLAHVRPDSRLIKINPAKFHRKIPLRKNFLKASNYRLNYRAVCDRVSILLGRNVSYSRIKHFWAHSLDESLFQLNGTLTAALNLAWILNYSKVHLVGVDLNNGLHFYPTDARIKDRDDRHHQINSESVHPTTVWSVDGDVPPVTAVLTQIARHYRNSRRTIVIANPDSLPARLGIIPHEPLLS